MNKLGVRLFLLNLIFLSLIIPQAKAQVESESSESETEHAEYSESALRRFEIITLSSIPFTAIHSYGVMRAVKMLRENQFAPELSPQDYRIIGIGAVSLSVFIGIWDWLHTRNVDRSAPLVPEPETPLPSEEEEPVEGTLTRLSETSPYIARYRSRSLQDSMNRGLSQWANEKSVGFALPLLQIRF
ncbi:hypothetical protein F4X10_16200 [Candidatus Poribacteria bacterium]|nr:hypothetical protein [Candidatus Poribacteria bacterium]